MDFWDRPIPGLNILSAIVLWLLVTTVLPLVFLSSIPNALGLALLFFNNLNMLIAICEILLGKHILFIQQDYLELKKIYEGKERQAAFAYLLMPLSISSLGWKGGKQWAKMWSTYSLYDTSYQNHESFGFFIDVGNGWSTIPPCLLWNAAILFPTEMTTTYFSDHACLVVGVVGCCSYWQVLYGTIIYLFSYIFNQRYKGRSAVEIISFVGCTNGIWFVFPMAGIYAAVLLLRDGDMVQVFR